MRGMATTWLAAVLAAVLFTSAHATDGPAAAADVLAQAREAAGGRAWDRLPALQGEGRIVTSGLPGTWREVDDLRGGRFKAAADVGTYRVSEGFDGRLRWRQDPSGGVHALDAPFSRRMRVTESWLARRGWLQAPGTDAAVRYGEVSARSEQDGQYEVFTATPGGGEAVELWFDAHTHLLARSVRRMPISTLVTRYGDYRELGGVQLPFRIESGETGGGSPDIVTIERWTTQPVGDSAFAPPRAPADTTLAAPTTVPLAVEGLITITATLNGKPYDFIVDTGGHDILTPDVARALGLEPVGAGASGGSGEGTLAQQDVRVASTQIGGATLRDQHFYVIPLQYDTVERGTKPPLAGILGLELFERLAVRIDYNARTMTLRTFAQAARERRRGEAVSIVFDDDMPLFEGRLAGEPGVIGLDTGNGGSVIVQAVWAKQHGLADAMKRGLETVSFGNGGESRNWASRLSTLQIGHRVLEHLVARYAEDKAGAFSSITEAANIGTDVLSHFVLDIDYSRHAIWFAPDPSFVPPPYSRSGLGAYKDDPKAFTVALVTPGTPAAEAGLKKGDRIVSVDGVDATRLSGRQLRAKWYQPAGAVVVLGVERGTDVQRVALTLREMLP